MRSTKMAGDSQTSETRSRVHDRSKEVEMRSGRCGSEASAESSPKEARLWRPPLLPALDNNMDKGSREDFTFAKLSDLKLPVTFRMSAASEPCIRTCLMNLDPSSRATDNQSHTLNFLRTQTSDSMVYNPSEIPHPKHVLDEDD